MQTFWAKDYLSANQVTPQINVTPATGSTAYVYDGGQDEKVRQNNYTRSTYVFSLPNEYNLTCIQRGKLFQWLLHIIKVRIYLLQLTPERYLYQLP